jgi:hypothetical protein
MPFSRQIRSNSTSVGGWLKPAGEHLAVVGEDLLRDPVGAHRGSQSVADRSGPLAGHQRRGHTEPGVVIHAGQRLAGGAVSEQEPADGVHLPQLHGVTAFPPLPGVLAPSATVGLDQSGAFEAPVDR